MAFLGFEVLIRCRLWPRFIVEDQLRLTPITAISEFSCDVCPQFLISGQDTNFERNSIQIVTGMTGPVSLEQKSGWGDLDQRTARGVFLTKSPLKVKRAKMTTQQETVSRNSEPGVGRCSVARSATER
jgi:hypothetical protein